MAYDDSPLTPIRLFQEILEKNRTYAPSKAQAYRLLKQRRENPAGCYRRPGKNRPGRPYNVTDTQLNELLNPQNPERAMGTDAMIDLHRLIVQPRALKRSLATRKKKARLYKRAKAKWVLHRRRIARIQYGEEHGDKNLEDRVNLGPVSDFPGPFGSTSVGQMSSIMILVLRA
ncbi:MAG: hypothetical protein Q9181_006785 [Wetmoreana brouardii]